MYKAAWQREIEAKFGSVEVYREEQNRKRLEREQEKAERQRQIEDARATREQERVKRRELSLLLKEQWKKERTLTKECVVCGNTFTTLNGAQKTCCKRCSKRLSSSRKHHRIPKEQIVDKDITLEALYRRDSGVCYLCGGKCDWSDRDKERNIVGILYPSIDHVIPIARGGLHAWSNVRLAHFWCNTLKNDKLIKGIDETGRAIGFEDCVSA
jgi:hypothetical protein